MVAKKMIALLKDAAVIGVLAGIVSAILGGVVGALALPYALDIIILVAILVLIAPKKLQNIKVFDMVVLFTMIGAVGTIITSFLPEAGSWILSVGDAFTVSGLLITFIWLAAAMWIKGKVKV